MPLKEIWETAGAVLVSVGGGGAIVVALSSWLGKVWANRILEADRAKYAREIEQLRGELERSSRLLQGEIEKTIFVTKTHFETEFTILREIWERVSETRTAISRLRPMSGYPTVRQEQEQHFNQVFDAFQIEVDKLRVAVDNNSPFYSQEIFETLDQLIRIAQAERDDLLYALDDRFGLEWFRHGKVNRELYLVQVEKCSALIRERLNKLAVRGLDLQ